MTRAESGAPRGRAPPGRPGALGLGGSDPVADRLHEARLACPILAHERHHLGLPDREADVVEGGGRAVADDQVLDLNHLGAPRRCTRHAPSGRARPRQVGPRRSPRRGRAPSPGRRGGRRTRRRAPHHRELLALQLTDIRRDSGAPWKMVATPSGVRSCAVRSSMCRPSQRIRPRSGARCPRMRFDARCFLVDGRSCGGTRRQPSPAGCPTSSGSRARRHETGPVLGGRGSRRGLRPPGGRLGFLRYWGRAGAIDGLPGLQRGMRRGVARRPHGRRPGRRRDEAAGDPVDVRRLVARLALGDDRLPGVFSLRPRQRARVSAALTSGG